VLADLSFSQGEFGYPGSEKIVFDLAMRGLDDKDELIRNISAGMLTFKARPPLQDFSSRGFEALISRYEKETSPLVKKNMLYFLGQKVNEPESSHGLKTWANHRIDEALTLLEKPAPENLDAQLERAEEILRLAGFPTGYQDDSHFARLEKLMTSLDPGRRRIASHLLGNSDDDRAVKSLFRVIADLDENLSDYARRIVSLRKRLGNSVSLKAAELAYPSVLNQLVGSPDPKAREWLAEYLAPSFTEGDVVSERLLARLLLDDTPRTRIAAEKAVRFGRKDWRQITPELEGALARAATNKRASAKFKNFAIAKLRERQSLRPEAKYVLAHAARNLNASPESACATRNPLNALLHAVFIH
jgi:hypothetical protein